MSAARRLALKRGGAEVVIHRVDGKVRGRHTIEAATIDEATRGGPGSARPIPGDRADRGRKRAPRSDGSRTTLRVPKALLAIADRLAEELNVSRNDALLRLTARDASLYDRERQVAQRRDRRWAAVVPGAVDVDSVPSPDEARDAVLGAREAATDRES